MSKFVSYWAVPCLFVATVTSALFLPFSQNLHPLTMVLFTILSVSIMTSEGWNINQYGTKAKVALVAVMSSMAFLTLISPSPHIAILESRQFAYLFLTTFLLSKSSRGTIKRIWLALAPLAAVLACWGISQTISDGENAHSTFADPNLYGALMVAASTGALAAALQAFPTSRAKAGTFFLLAGVTTLAAFFAHSRSAWLAFIVATGVILLRKDIRSAVGVKKALLGISLIVTLAVIGTMAKTRGDLAGQKGLGESFNSRVAMLQSTVKMGLDAPLLGQGWGIWSLRYPKYRLAKDTDSGGNRAHNDYLEAWASGGLVGELLVLSIPVLLVLASRRGNQKTKASSIHYGLQIAGGTLVLQAAINFVFHEPATCLLLGLLLSSLLIRAGSSDDEPKVGLSTAAKGGLALTVPLTMLFGIAEALTSTATTLMDGTPIDANSPKALVLAPPVLATLEKALPLSPLPHFVEGIEAEMAGKVNRNDTVKKKQNYDVALEHFDKALRVNPFEAAATYHKVTIYMDYPGWTKAQQMDKAEKLLKAQLELDPTPISMVGLYAGLLVTNHRTSEARAVIAKAVEHSGREHRKALEAIRIGTEKEAAVKPKVQ